MKMKLLAFFALALSASPALAGPVMGRATLTFYMDGFFDEAPSGVISYEIWEKDGKISGITPNATYMVATDAGFKGWFNGRYQDFGCTHSISSDPEALGCNNQLASGSADLIMKKSMSEIKGSIAMRSVRATHTTKEITIEADGALYLKWKRDGVYTGSGSLDSTPYTHASQVILETSGSMKDLKDPALFAIFLMSTLVETR